MAAVVGQLALRRLASAPAEPQAGAKFGQRRPASCFACWPGRMALLSTQQHADRESGQELGDAGRSDVLETGSDEEGV